MLWFFKTRLKTSPKYNKYSPLRHNAYIHNLVKGTVSILLYGDIADWLHCSSKKQHQIKTDLFHPKLGASRVKRPSKHVLVVGTRIINILKFKIEKEKDTRKKEAVLVLTRTSLVQKTN